jgi:hypothetical protein
MCDAADHIILFAILPLARKSTCLTARCLQVSGFTEKDCAFMTFRELLDNAMDAAYQSSQEANQRVTPTVIAFLEAVVEQRDTSSKYCYLLLLCAISA